MNRDRYDLWSAEVRSLRGIPQAGELLPAGAVLDEGQVVILVRRGEAPLFGTRGPHVVRDGALIPVGESPARDLVDPARAAERRYADACYVAGLHAEERRYVEPAGHDWQAETAYPADDEGLALELVTRVRGRHVWRRAASYAEAMSLGVTP